MVDLAIGQELTWLHTPRGGYGYVIPVNAVITKIGRKRVQVKIAKRNGEKVLRWVSPTSLRERDGKGGSN